MVCSQINSEKIHSIKGRDYFEEKVNLKKSHSTKRLKSSKMLNNEQLYKVNDDKSSTTQLEVKMNLNKFNKDKSLKKPKLCIYDNLLGKQMKISDSSIKINSNSVNFMKINSVNDSMNNSHNNSMNTNIPPKEKHRTLNKSLSLELLDNKKLRISSSLINLIKDEEEKGKNGGKKRSFQRTESLYQIRFKKNESLKTMKKQLEEYRMMNEMEDCTFRPNINSDYVKREKSPILNQDSNISFYERVNMWKKKKIEKNDQEKKLSKTKEFEKCTFQPSISTNVPVYNDINTFDEGTIRYFERLQKARGERMYIKNKLNSNFSTFLYK